MGLAVVSSRVIGDSTLTLAASGWTYGMTFVLYDHQTESMWFPTQFGNQTMGLRAITGFYAGRELQPLPLEVTSWSDWLSSHPGSPIMR